jgi:hypothetical protein
VTILAPPDLSEPLRTAIVTFDEITSKLEAYKNSFPVFTKRPVPEDSPKTCIVVSPDITVDEDAAINYLRPVITRDVTVYGNNDAYRDVEALSRLVVRLFNRSRKAIVVPQWGVTLVTTVGPSPAPADDDKTVARVVQVRVALSAKG